MSVILSACGDGGGDGSGASSDSSSTASVSSSEASSNSSSANSAGNESSSTSSTSESSSQESSSEASSQSSQAALPAFAACFDVPVGKRYYTQTIGTIVPFVYKNLVVSEDFQGTTYTGRIRGTGNDATTWFKTRNAATYWRITGTSVEFPGEIVYLGDSDRYRIYTPTPSFPLDAQPGAQSARYSEVNTYTGSSSYQNETYTVSVPITFVGFETIEIDGMRFENACHMAIPYAFVNYQPGQGSGVDSLQIEHAWFAPGVGFIKANVQLVDNTVFLSGEQYRP